MKKNKYFWQGEPVKVEFGNCIVKKNKEKPLWWYNYECSLEPMYEKACIPAIRITASWGEPFVISNHCGIGVYKLMKGGWPDSTHFSLDGKFSTKPQLKITEFDLEAFQQHEAERRKWQIETYPEEMAKIKGLEDMIKMRARINLKKLHQTKT